MTSSTVVHRTELLRRLSLHRGALCVDRSGGDDRARLSDGLRGDLHTWDTLLLHAPRLLLHKLRLLLTDLHRHGTALDGLAVQHDLDRDEALNTINISATGKRVEEGKGQGTCDIGMQVKR